MESLNTPVTMPLKRLILWAIAALVLGLAIAFVPSVVQDLRFLHAARLYNEQQAQLALQQQQQQQAARPPASASSPQGWTQTDVPKK